MGKKYTQLSLEERYTIAALSREGQSLQKIAAAMARSASTISREIKRNITKTKGYAAAYAQEQTRGRRWTGSKLERQPALRSTVLNNLTMGMSPQQISGRLARERGCNVISYESIYRFIYAQIKRTSDSVWRNYLPRRKYRRGHYRAKSRSSASFIKKRVSIHERPEHIAKRSGIGHWEADLMLFSQQGEILLVTQERYSRMILLFKLQDKQSKTLVKQLLNLANYLPSPLFQTMSFDNGSEFSEHHQLNELGIKTYFCDIKSPWQKGGVENAIGRLRTPLPRKGGLAQFDMQEIEQIGAIFNHTPRKCLDYQTPAEVFLKQLLHFKCEFTPSLRSG